MEQNAKILVTGRAELIGAALLRCLNRNSFSRLLTAEFNLTDQEQVGEFFNKERPDYVFLTSAKVGGILANNTYPADFIYNNLMSEANVIHAAWKAGVKKLLFVGSSCIYPKNCPQPMREEYLLSGKLEPTSEPYAISKIAGVKMCQSYNRQFGTHFISAIPADAYGPDDDFDPETGHVQAALMSRIHRAKTRGEAEVVVWGTGAPKREMLYVDDLADACIFLMDNYDQSEIINVGSGEDISIKDLGYLLKESIRYEGKLTFDDSKPDGMPRKLLDTSKISRLGWKPRTTPEKGIKETYKWYKEHYDMGE